MQNNFLYSNSRTVKFRAINHSIVNMRIDLDKNLNKDVFHTIKATISYPPKLAWNKIRYVIVCKLRQITKKLIILGRLRLPFT